jgi:hypothetical protein
MNEWFVLGGIICGVVLSGVVFWFVAPHMARLHRENYVRNLLRRHRENN